MKKRKFKPKPGQIDYTRARWAPVVNCVVKYRDTILIVRRSKELKFYPGHWNGISGFLDDHKSLEDKVQEELHEELGIPSVRIKKILRGEIFHQESPRYKKTWIVHPVLIEVSSDKVRLDWESTNYRWIKPREARQYKLVPGFREVLKRALPLFRK